MAEISTASVRFRKHTLDNVSWTAIRVSAFCHRVEIENGGPDIVYLRTDPDLAESEHELASGAAFKLECRQNPLTPTCYAKTDSSTGPLKVKEITDGAP
jgi:hypothetical protein